MPDKFTPISIIPDPSWRTPDFNPAIADKNRFRGLSPQTQQGLMLLEKQMQQETDKEKQWQMYDQYIKQQQQRKNKMYAIDPNATYQLPNGKYVTKDVWDKLQQKLKYRK